MCFAICLHVVYNRAMIEDEIIYLTKAIESLHGAESEYINGRYHNCANRCYYACFQAGVHALTEAGITASGTRATWSHESLQGTFARELITRRKVYPAEFHDMFARTYKLRQTADYTRDLVTEMQAARTLRRVRDFVEAVQTQTEGETL